MTRFKIVGTGSSVPSRIITNEELEATCETNGQWVYEKLGIRERHILSEGQTISDLATESAKIALDSAGLVAKEIDLLIVGTTTAEKKSPSTACIVQNKLGKLFCPAFDISAACSSFLYGLTTAGNFIGNGSVKRALIIGADTYSTITDWQHRDAVFFGDAAGAVVIEADNDQIPWSFYLGADGSCGDFFKIVPNTMQKETPQKRSSYIYRLKGKELFHAAMRTIPVAAANVLSQSVIRVDEIDFVVPHQASLNLLHNLADKLNVPKEKLLTSMENFGNTAAASQPLTLDYAIRSGKIQRGMNLLFLAFGGGITYGAGLGKY